MLIRKYVMNSMCSITTKTTVILNHIVNSNSIYPHTHIWQHWRHSVYVNSFYLIAVLGPRDQEVGIKSLN